MQKLIQNTKIPHIKIHGPNQTQSWDFQAMEILYMWLYLASLLPIYKVNFMVCCATDILQDKQDVNLGARH